MKKHSLLVSLISSSCKKMLPRFFQRRREPFVKLWTRECLLLVLFCKSFISFLFYSVNRIEDDFSTYGTLKSFLSSTAVYSIKNLCKKKTGPMLLNSIYLCSPHMHRMTSSSPAVEPLGGRNACDGGSPVASVIGLTKSALQPR